MDINALAWNKVMPLKILVLLGAFWKIRFLLEIIFFKGILNIDVQRCIFCYGVVDYYLISSVFCVLLVTQGAVWCSKMARCAMHLL
jgi:hypothetical protein